MKNKLQSYFLLCAISFLIPYKMSGVQVIYAEHNSSAVAAGTIVGAVCGIGLGALIASGCRTFDHTCWLYFSNDILVQWGRPEDWKKEADNIQEIRYR
jgi:hypothetical protein